VGAGRHLTEIRSGQRILGTLVFHDFHDVPAPEHGRDAKNVEFTNFLRFILA
jgi:hypothetical protein